MFGAGAASAATVSIGAGGIIYEAQAREANRAKMVYGSPQHTFYDFGATLKAGSGCSAGPPITCPHGTDVIARLGDRDDVGVFNMYGTDGYVWGGTGNDRFVVGGNGGAYGYGEDGNDVVHLVADGATYGYGGKGNDWMSSSASSYDLLDGGPGNDVLKSSGYTRIDVGGGDGDDVVAGSSRYSLELDGGGGDDAVIATGGTSDTAAISGGAGTDFLEVRAPSQVDAGAGTDWIDARQGDDTPADTITCGTGVDFAWIDPQDTVDDTCEVPLLADPPETPQLAAAKQRLAESHPIDPEAGN